jgi:hypothetical protein
MNNLSCLLLVARIVAVAGTYSVPAQLLLTVLQLCWQVSASLKTELLLSQQLARKCLQVWLQLCENWKLAEVSFSNIKLASKLASIRRQEI